MEVENKWSILALDPKAQKLFELMMHFSSHGIKLLPNGTLLIGKDPKARYEYGWTNKVFPPLFGDEGLLKLKEELSKIGLSLTPDLEYFLTYVSNGLKVSSNYLTIYGYRRNSIRNAVEVFQPYCMVQSNLGRPKNLPENALIFGSYSENGSHVYMLPDDPKIYFCSPKDAMPLKVWDNLWDWLLPEIERLYTVVDEGGFPIGSGIDTLPVPPADK